MTDYAELMAKINKRFGKGAVMLGSDPALEITKVSTGILSMDCMLNGGWARGRAIEVYGQEGVGKTLLAMRSLERMQNLGLRVGYANVERVFPKEIAVKCGVDLDNLDIIPQLESAGKMIDTIGMLMQSGLYGMIVVDSIAALVPKSEAEGSLEEGNMGMGQAKVMSQGLRKVNALNTNTTVMWINQMRENVGVMYGAKYRTSGGHAMKYWATSRVELTNVGAIKGPGWHVNAKNGDIVYGNEEKIGHRIVAKLEKDKAGSQPKTECTWIVDYNTGLNDPIEDLVYCGQLYGIVKREGAKAWTVGNQRLADRPKLLAYLRSNEKAAKAVEAKVRAKAGL